MDFLDERSLAVLLERDSIYQQLLKACLQYEVEYQRICARLCQEDRLQLTRYISLCEELDHRKLQLVLSNL